MNDLFKFVKCPNYTGSFIKLSVRDFFILFVIYFISVIPFGAIAGIVSSLLGLTSKVQQLTMPREIIYGVLLAPIIEEVFFRLIYVFSQRNLVIILSASVLFEVYFIVNENLLKSIIFLVAIILVIALILNFNRSRTNFYKHFSFFFYFIAGLFAIIHLGNFTGLSLTSLMLGLLMVIPQFLAGIILGYIRVRFGFIYAIIFHTLVNLTLLFQL
jgi:hypothetical protein